MSAIKQFRFTIRFLTALVVKYYLAIFLGIFLGVSSFVIAPKISRMFPQIRSSYSIGLVGRYTQAEIPQSIQQKVSIGLTAIDPTGIAQPALSTSWEVRDNGLTYAFKLNTDYRWQDGSQVKASDINYQFRDTQTEYPNDQEIVIKLKDAYAPLPVVVSRPIFKSGLLGLGAYKTQRVKKNGNFIDVLYLEPMDRTNHLPNLSYHFYPSEAQAKTAYKLGVVQSLEEIQNPGELLNWPNTRYEVTTHFDRYVAVFFNTNSDNFKGPSGKNLRQALAYAIDKSGYPNRAISPISSLSWAYNPEVKKYDFDLDRAKQLLIKVEKIPDKITLHTSGPFLALAEQVKANWESLGITTDIISTSDVPADFEVLIIAQATPIDPDQYNQWHSTQATNLTGVNSPRIDKLLEDGRKTLDLAQRKNIYQDFQRYLVEETPAVFLFHPQSYTLIRK